MAKSVQRSAAAIHSRMVSSDFLIALPQFFLRRSAALFQVKPIYFYCSLLSIFTWESFCISSHTTRFKFPLPAFLFVNFYPSQTMSSSVSSFSISLLVFFYSTSFIAVSIIGSKSSTLLSIYLTRLSYSYLSDMNAVDN